jgi:hypothetical protein
MAMRQRLKPGYLAGKNKKRSGIRLLRIAAKEVSNGLTEHLNHHLLSSPYSSQSELLSENQKCGQKVKYPGTLNKETKSFQHGLSTSSNGPRIFHVF